MAALFWGLWFPLARTALRSDDLSSADLAFLRFLTPAVLLLPVVLRHGLKAGKAGWAGSIVMTMAVGFPYPLFIAIGLEFAPAAHGALFVPGTFPVTTAIAGFLLLRDPIGWRGLLGTLLVAAGVGGVGWIALSSSYGQWQGYGLFFACAWMWAAYSISIRIAQISALHGAGIISVLSIIIFAPVYLIWGDIRFTELAWPQLVGQAAYQGLGVGLIAMVAYNHAVNLLGAARAAIFGGLVPCIAATAAVPIAGEPLGTAEILGIIAVTAGIAIVNGAGWRRPQRKTAGETTGRS